MGGIDSDCDSDSDSDRGLATHCHFFLPMTLGRTVSLRRTKLAGSLSLSQSVSLTDGRIGTRRIDSDCDSDSDTDRGLATRFHFFLRMTGD